MQQHTLQQSVSMTGIGLHSGRDVSVTLKPAPPDTGIVFCRVDLPGAPVVEAVAQNITDTYRATTLCVGQCLVHTVEHLLAAIGAFGIDNIRIEIDAAEPPVQDGSALPFARMIRDAGIAEQSGRLKVRRITVPQWVQYPDKFIAILPYDGLRISFTSVNPHPSIGIQYGDYEITPEVFLECIAPARTIGFMHEIEALKAQGLALGGSLDNAVVYDGDKVLTPLRFPDELVRHKILDVIGDLVLTGRLFGHVIAVKSGHALNAELSRRIVSNVEKT